MTRLASAALCLFIVRADAFSQTQPLRPILDVLPAENELGPGWKREIATLFDSAGQPSEIVNTSLPLGETYLQKHRREVADPQGRTSGWCHAHYDAKSEGRSERYEVHIERYRNRELLLATFQKLAEGDTNKYQIIKLNQPGETAVLYRQGPETTLWLRRDNLCVSISPLFAAPPWEEDKSLRHLTMALDQRLMPTRRERSAQPSKEKKQP